MRLNWISCLGLKLPNHESTRSVTIGVNKKAIRAVQPCGHWAWEQAFAISFCLNEKRTIPNLIEANPNDGADINFDGCSRWFRCTPIPAFKFWFFPEWNHPDERNLIFVSDLSDRGIDSIDDNATSRIQGTNRTTGPASNFTSNQLYAHSYHKSNFADKTKFKFSWNAMAINATRPIKLAEATGLPDARSARDYCKPAATLAAATF